MTYGGKYRNTVGLYIVLHCSMHPETCGRDRVGKSTT